MRLAEAVEALESVNPDASLRAAYCHRVVRHTVLWAQSRITGDDVKVGGQPIGIPPGTCSNPDPLPAIRELPLGDIDLARYMLAEAEIAAGVDVGVTAKLSDRLAHGLIPVMELSLRMKKMQVDIDRLDADRLAADFTSYLEVMTYMSKEGSRLRTAFDPLAPERGQIPALDRKPPYDPAAERAAISAFLAYGIRAALAGRRNAMLELEVALDNVFAGVFPGKPLFDCWKRMRTILQPLDQAVASSIRALLRGDHVEPNDFWMAGLRFFEQINQSNFKKPLIPQLARWQRIGWKRIIADESFRLYRPLQTVPAIKVVLAVSADDRQFVAKLLLTTCEAVGAALGREYRERLRAISEEAESSPNVA